MRKLLLVLEELNSPAIVIPFPHLCHATDPGSAEYSNSDDGAEHQHCLNSVCPDDGLQATLEWKTIYFYD